jgi:dipeptidyl aminopeptidase/acylaminoacyl peptidase
MPSSIEDFVRVERADTPSFSADGGSLAFRWNATGRPQAYLLDLEAGEKRQLTDSEGVVYGLRWRPGHDEALFVTDDGGDEAYQLRAVTSAGEARELVVEAGVICNPGAFSRDGGQLSYGSNRRDRRFFDIWVHDLASGEDRCVLQRDSMLSAGRFTADGRGLLVAAPNLEVPGDNNVWLLDLEGADPEPTLLTAHDPEIDGPAEWLGAAPHPGGAILVLSDEGREFRGLQRIDPASGERAFELTYDWDIEGFAVAEAGDRLAVVVNEDGISRLEAFELTPEGRVGGSITLPGLPEGIVSGATWAPDGRRLALTFESAAQMPNVWLLDLAGGEARQVTEAAANGVDPSTLLEPELIRYPTFDGHEVPAFYYRPAGVADDELLPCIVLVHGGPEGQSRPALWGRYAAPQYLLARGDVALLVPNVRGSTGYGRAYSHADDVELRMDSVRDLNAATDWLAASGGVDPSRIGVMGGSYGGFMVLAAITEEPERWGAAVDLFGIANFETFLKFTGPWRRKHRAREYGEDPEFLRTISPIHKAERIRTPLLVIQGDHDVRVPPEESEQIVETVRRNEGVVEYVVYEREGHGIQKLPHRLDMGERIVSFLEEHLIGG